MWLLKSFNKEGLARHRNLSKSIWSSCCCACSLCVRGVSSLTWTARRGAPSSRSSAPSQSRCGTSTTTASFSRLGRDGTPSSWRRNGPWEITCSPSRKGCLIWRYGGGSHVQVIFNVFFEPYTHTTLSFNKMKRLFKNVIALHEVKTNRERYTTAAKWLTVEASLQ